MWDCIIIGSGPAGCSAAIYLGMAGKKTLLFTGDIIGGLLTKTHIVDNYLGLPDVSGMEITDIFVKHASKYASIKNRAVKKIVDKTTHLEVYYDNELVEKTKYVIISSGSNPQKLGVSGEDLGGVSYCAICDGFLYKGKTVIVVGGGNSAFEDAIYLSGVAKSVYLIHRSDKFRAFQCNIDKVRNTKNITIITNCTIDKFIGGDDNNIQSVNIRYTKTNTIENMKIDGVFVAIGYISNTSLINLDNKNGYIIVGKNYQTSNMRIFACGDCIEHDLMVRYKQAICSASEGCICGLEVSRLLDMK